MMMSIRRITHSAPVAAIPSLDDLRLGCAVAALIAATLPMAGCGSRETAGPTAGSKSEGIALSGAGATFPYPIYSRWADRYKQTAGVRVNYQSIGSGGGVQQIKSGTVDFGASDAPLTAKELDEAGLIQFPMVMGGVVPVVNIPLQGRRAGPQIRLTPVLLAGIFLGKITKWNDAALVRENPVLRDIDTNITVVHRSDGSGTTWIFTNYLAKVSPDWARRVGFGKSVDWPAGVGGKGNEGVAAYVQRIEGAIGYVEYAYAVENRMAHASLRNKAGSYVEPSIDSFQAAAANAAWETAPGFHVILTDQDGARSWPITGASFIIIYRNQKDAKKGRAMLQFFDWAYTHGADMARELEYVPMPESVVNLVRQRWSSQVTHAGKPLWGKP
mgnify:CR=1 FL=1